MLVFYAALGYMYLGHITAVYMGKVKYFIIGYNIISFGLMKIYHAYLNLTNKYVNKTEVNLQMYMNERLLLNIGLYHYVNGGIYIY